MKQTPPDTRLITNMNVKMYSRTLAFRKYVVSDATSTTAKYLSYLSTNTKYQCSME